MISRIAVAGLLLVLSSALGDEGRRDESPAAVLDVLRRLLGDRAAAIRLESIPAVEGRDTFEYEAKDGLLTVRGSSPVAMARGAYEYLRACNLGMVTRYGVRLALPERWPDAAAARVTTPFAFRQQYNVVSAGYVFPYWDWAQWERELDYDALHGYNLLMAPAATEAIMARVWKRVGLSQQEIDAFTPGPAHLPWFRMGNLTRHDGPLTAAWHADQIALQHKLLDRMRALGMEPIIQGFAGFVPSGIQRLHPELKLHTTAWGGFPADKRALVLAPDQPLYAAIQKFFLEEYRREFGACRYVLVDSFNEMDLPPGRPAAELLADYGQATHRALEAAQPDSVWVIQGWMFGYQRNIWNAATVEALLSRVPDDRMLILDYPNDYNAHFWRNGMDYAVFKGFHGKPWLGGVVPNMGNNTPYTGVLSFYAEYAGCLQTTREGENRGICVCPEGFENNEVIYEALADSAWRTGAMKLEDWLPGYCLSRYGGYPPEMKRAWEIFRATCYASLHDHPRHAWSFMGLGGKGSLNADPRFHEAAAAFLSCAGSLGESPLYRADALEIAAQSQGFRADEWFAVAAQAYREGRAEEGDRARDRGLRLLLDLDRLLESHPTHRLGRWLDFTQAHGGSPAEKARYAANARRLITVWGPPINDYAAKMWSGLTRDFYAPRMQALLDSLRDGKSFDRGPWEERWVKSSVLSHIEPFADPLFEAGRLVSGVLAEPAPSLKALKGEVIANWTPADMTLAWKVLEWPLSTDQLKTLHGVRFVFTGGNHRLEVKSVTVLADGREIARDEHAGYAGVPSHANVYRFDIPVGIHANNGGLLRAAIKSGGGTVSSGRVEIIGE
jgi:alpha-N-acetylglucosaminidase